MMEKTTVVANHKLRLTEQCVFKSLFYLSEATQYYWPAAKHQAGYIHNIAENNIALHLARSFSENGFLVWAEIPFTGAPTNKLDFLAYNYSLDILVALELKNNIETPQNNLHDLHRLVDIHAEGICNEEHPFNNQGIGDKKPDVFGIISLLNATEFAEWWQCPNRLGSYKPEGHPASDYEKIGKALEVSKNKAVMPLLENIHPDADLKYRLYRAAYALYDESTIGDLAEVLKN